MINDRCAEHESYPPLPCLSPAAGGAGWGEGARILISDPLSDELY
jgi:hypothetical protein